MRMILLMALVNTLLLASAVLSFAGADGQKREILPNPASVAPGIPYGGKTAPKGMTGVIQDATLAGYKNVKIGEAFEKYRYFKTKEWSEARGKGDIFYVDFVGLSPVGWFNFDARRKGISSRGIVIKFVIHPNGTYGVGMVSKLEVKTDGKTNRYPLSDINSILDAIYANKEISY